MDENHDQNHVPETASDEGTPNEGTVNQGTANEGTPGSPVAAQPQADAGLAESVIDSATATDAATSPTTAIDSTAEPTASMEAQPSATLPIVASGRRANRNSLRHGLRSSPATGLVRLELGSLPDSLHRVERGAWKFRGLLEQAVADVHGSVTLLHALAINTAARWERHGALALRWLREAGDTLTAEQRLSYSREIARASAERDKAIAGLKLNPNAKENIFAMLYGERTNGA